MDIFKHKYVPCHILGVLILRHYSLFIWNSTWPGWLIFYLATVLQKKAEGATVLGSEGWVVHRPWEQSHDRLHLWPILDSGLGLLYCLSMLVLKTKNKNSQAIKKKIVSVSWSTCSSAEVTMVPQKEIGLIYVQIPAWWLAHCETSHKQLSFSEPQNLFSEMKTRISACQSCWEDCDNVSKLPSECKRKSGRYKFF